MFLIICMVNSCASSKTPATPEQIAAIKTLIEDKNFNMEFDWAYPQNTFAVQQVLNSTLMQPGVSSGSAVNLIGNSNFLTIKGDSISSHLPYFGEQRMAVNYPNTDGGIRFDGLLENYSIKKNKDNSYSVFFNARSKSELFDVNLILFPNQKVSMILNGTTRTSIRYSGAVTRN